MFPPLFPQQSCNNFERGIPACCPGGRRFYSPSPQKASRKDNEITNQSCHAFQNMPQKKSSTYPHIINFSILTLKLLNMSHFPQPQKCLPPVDVVHSSLIPSLPHRCCVTVTPKPNVTHKRGRFGGASHPHRHLPASCIMQCMYMHRILRIGMQPRQEGPRCEVGCWALVPRLSETRSGEGYSQGTGTSIGTFGSGVRED
jgi:hypothetical protein